MKVVVSKIPKESKECLFSTKIFKEDNTKKVGFSWHYGCSMDGKCCDFKKGRGCNKLTEFNVEYHMRCNY